RLKINPIIGFLIVGAFIGPNVLGELAKTFPWLSILIIGEREEIARLAELGVVFLLFIVGIELSFERVLSLRRLVIGFGSIQVMTSAIVIGYLLQLLGLPVTESLIIGLGLSLSSTAIVIQLLSEQKRLGTQSGRTSFAVLLFQDLAVVPILLLIPALSPDGGNRVAGSVVMALLLAGVTILLIVVIGRLVLRPMLRLVASTRSPDLFMAATLLIVVGAAIISTVGGMSMALGAFIAGLLLAETEYRREIEAIVEPFKGILLGTYFLLVGMGMNLKLLLAYPLVIFGFAVALIGIKAAIIYATGGFFRIPKPALMRTALLLGPGGEFAFVIMAAGTAAGAVSLATSENVILVVSLTMMLIPLMSAAGNWVTAKFSVKAALPPEALAEPSPESDVRAIVVGYGRVGTLVGSMLEEHSIPYVGIEADPEVLARARRAGKPLYYGDATRPELLRKCGIGKAFAIVVTMDSPSKIDQVVRTARAIRPDIKIIARARDENHAMELYRAGVTEAVPETSEASLQLGEAVLVEVGVPMGVAIAAIHERRDALRRLLGRPDRRREVGLARERLKKLKQKEKS
ncbi:MAG TPA: cation:proton antiporter, partial [Aestuariivirgaceae bacterium]|nr:cation:proton antiporter [Aestuariivirgaceae bacterium]